VSYSLHPDQLNAYRAKTFCTAPGLRLSSPEEAKTFVDHRGFVFFWPTKGITFPSLWCAVAGDRPVAEKHNDPGHQSWDWKDKSLGKRVWYYARLLRRRNVFISLEIAPDFYALSPNFGDMENDYLEQYHAGELTLECKLVYEALLHEGPLNTLDLKKAAHLSSLSNDGRFTRALDDLQIQMKILPVGVAEAGSWNYAFIYDIVPRHFPDLPARAATITERNARQKLVELFFLSLGAARIEDLARLFSWSKEDALPAVQPLLADHQLVENVEINNQSGNFLALSDLVI
jgi:hypothetical protein